MVLSKAASLSMSTTRIVSPWEKADVLCATREDPRNAVEKAFADEIDARRIRTELVRRTIMMCILYF